MSKILFSVKKKISIFAPNKTYTSSQNLNIMKQLLFVVKVFCAFLISSFSVVSVSAQERLAGDANGDGKITIADFAIVVEIVNGRMEDTYGVADLNGDGVVDENDLKQMDEQALEPISNTAIAIINGQEVEVEWVRLVPNGPKWAVINVGATDVAEAGGTYSWNDQPWGPNWRKPSIDEMRELESLETNLITYPGTKMQGLSVEGNTGGSLFLPMPKVTGTQYWTSNEEKEIELDNGKFHFVNHGCYFEFYVDGAGVGCLYDTAPKSTKRYLRLIFDEE